MRPIRLLAAMLLAPGAAGAQAIDLSHGGPVNVTAAGGIDWDQAAQTVTAHEDARATRGAATVTADRLIAHYRRKTGAAAASASGSPPAAVASPVTPPSAAPPAAGGPAAPADAGNNEIYRLNAEGRVHIFTATDQAWGDHAIYDIDQAVLVLTGNGLRLTTPQDLLTARDAMEYWSAKHMAVARGDASATSTDGRRIVADVLVGYTVDPNAPHPPAGAAPPKKPAAAPKQGAAPGADPATPGKLERVEAYGHVQVRTATEIVTGDRGVYLPDTGLAHVAGNVHITRGENQLNGAAAVVNMKTGLATLTQAPGGRVQGLVVPNGSGRLRGASQRLREETHAMTVETRPMRRVTDANREALRVLAPTGGLVATGIGKTYRKRPVVRNVSVQVRRGEAVGLLGPNGAGKTTSFYMIVGLVRPDTGSITLDGADITMMPMYRRARMGIGYLPQEASVFRGLNVEQNIMAALEVVEPDPDARDLACDALLGEFGIGHLRRTPALALSGGERRRVEIARALATQPSYILLDEPLAGIDPIAVGEIRDLVRHLKHRGLGVLITDHNVRETLEIIDRAYIMHDGQVLMEGVPAEVVANVDVRRVYLGEKFSL